MYRTSIAIVDASRARLFSLDRTTDEQGTHEDLVEHTDLVNPARRLTPAQLFSDSPPFDDHRDAHIDTLDLGFAREISAELHERTRNPSIRRLIICASPRMLGALRKFPVERDGLVVDEIARDLVKMTPPQIRDQLTSYGLLPA